MTGQRIIRSYYAIAGTYTLAASLIWGVNTLFLLDAGLDIFEVFVANAAYTVGTVLFEIPTGVLADTRGRRVSFLVSVCLLFLTTLGYVAVAWVGGGLLGFCVVSMLIGLGFTFYSGATDAWLVDALQSVGHDGQLDGVFARGSMITGGAMLIGSIGGGVLGTWDLSYPYIARAAALCAVFAMAWVSMHDLGFTPRTLTIRSIPREMRSVLGSSLRHGFAVAPLRLLMGVRLVQWGFLMWAWYAWQPYFLELWGAGDAVWVAGAVSAAMSLAMIAGNGLVERLTRYCGRRTTMMAWAMATQVVMAMGVGLAPNFWLALTCFLIMVGSAGVMGPVRSASIHKLIASEHRASVTSFDSMGASVGSIAGQCGLGWVSRARSIPDGFLLGGFASLLGLPILYALRRLDDRSDFIVGERAAEIGGCPSGAPAIGQVDANT